jgi:hypothetical protein
MGFLSAGPQIVRVRREKCKGSLISEKREGERGIYMRALNAWRRYMLVPRDQGGYLSAGETTERLDHVEHIAVKERI